MKAKHLALIAFLTVPPVLAHAQPHVQHVPDNARAESAAATAPHSPVAQAPAPSDSVGEFVERTVVVARQQAEDEVHYETRRQINKVFSRLLQR